MGKIKKYLFVFAMAIFMGALFDSQPVFAETKAGEELDRYYGYFTFNPDANGNPSNVFSVDEVINEDTGETIQKQVQYTRSRDIIISFDFPEEELSRTTSIDVCETISANSIGAAQDKKECTKYFVDDKEVIYQIVGRQDGEKVLYVTLNYSSGGHLSVGKTIYLDTTGPVIDLKGGEYVYVAKGEKYSELGAECEDANELSKTCSVDIEKKEIDMNKSGFQYIIYTAKDFLGNETNVSRKIMVEVKKDEGGIDMFWFFAIGAIVITALSLTYIVIKNKDKQKNQSVL